MGKLIEEAERIAEDFRHGKKLDEKSAGRLVDLVLTLAHRVEALTQYAKTQERFRRYSVGD